MTASRADRSGPLAALVLAMSVGSAGAEEFSRPAELPAAPPVAARPVAADAASAPDLDAAGLISAATSGLPASMWRGTPIGVARLSIASLPAAPASRALRDVQFRLLAMAATPPVADGSLGASLFALRVERLAAMGEGEILNELLRAAGERETEPLARLAIDALLMAGERTSACVRFESAAFRDSGGWWDQARLVCKALARDRGGVATALEKVRAAADVEPAFLELAARAAGGPVRALPGSFHPTGPIVALLDVTGTLPPESELARALPPLLRGAIEAPSIPLARRVALAERAERAGIIEPERLGELYKAHAGDVSARGPAADRARRFVALRDAGDDTAVLAAVVQLLSRPDAPAAGGAIRAGLRKLAPLAAQGSAPVAVAGMRAMLHLGDFAGARRWHAAISREGSGDAALRALPLAILAGAVDPDATWYDRWTAATSRPATERAIAASLAAGLGLPGVSAADAGRLAAALADPPPAHRLAAAREAVAAGRIAEALGLVLALADDGPLAEMHPVLAGLIVETLRGVGLVEPARAFAVEYALAAGL